MDGIDELCPYTAMRSFELALEVIANDTESTAEGLRKYARHSLKLAQQYAEANTKKDLGP